MTLAQAKRLSRTLKWVSFGGQVRVISPEEKAGFKRSYQISATSNTKPARTRSTPDLRIRRKPGDVGLLDGTHPPARRGRFSLRQTWLFLPPRNACEGGNDCVCLGEICFRRGDHRFDDDGHNCFVSINDRIQSGDDHVRTINNQDELGHDRLPLGDHDLQYGNNRFVPINNRFRYGDNYSRSARPELADSPGLDVRPK